jgi:pimeloyl-ACP methyl ester carboxylesterase
LEGLMLQTIPVHAEGARYTAPLLYLPELWAPARVWLPAATFFGHRGWEGELLELRGAGDLEMRTAGVIDHARRLPQPPVVIGHGAGALVALAASRRGGVAAAVLIAPLIPGSAPVRGLTRRWEALLALALGRPIPPPSPPAACRLFGEVPPGLEAETVRAVLDVVRGGPPSPARLDVPALVVAGALDPLLPPGAAAGLAASLGADLIEIPGAGHWPILAPAWQRTVAAVHRWLVQRLGEPLLDLYADAMAERDAGGDPDAE